MYYQRLSDFLRKRDATLLHVTERRREFSLLHYPVFFFFFILFLFTPSLRTPPDTPLPLLFIPFDSARCIKRHAGWRYETCTIDMPRRSKMSLLRR